MVVRCVPVLKQASALRAAETGTHPTEQNERNVKKERERQAGLRR